MSSPAATVKSQACVCADDKSSEVNDEERSESGMLSASNEQAGAMAETETGLDQDQDQDQEGGQVVAGQIETLYIRGVPIVSITIDGVKRLCLAQISNTLLAKYSYNEIHNRRVALGINCVQCTPVQLELLRRVGAMPTSSRRCGMITLREADRLVRSFLDNPEPPKLPKDFAFNVEHECGWGCKGTFHVARYTSSRAKCVCCSACQTFFSPNKFIFHFHRNNSNMYKHPDAANFNSWRRHLFLQDRASASAADLSYAWEDVKAMFNGGNRKRSLTPGAFSLHGEGSAESFDDNGPDYDTDKPISFADACDRSVAESSDTADALKCELQERDSALERQRATSNNNDGLTLNRESDKSGSLKRTRVTDAAAAAFATAQQLEPKKMRLSEKADLHLSTAHAHNGLLKQQDSAAGSNECRPNSAANTDEFATLLENAAAQLLHSQPTLPFLPPGLLSPVTPTTSDASNLLLSGLFQSFYQNYQQMLAQTLQQQQMNLVSILESSKRDAPKQSSARKGKDQPTDYSISKLIN